MTSIEYDFQSIPPVKSPEIDLMMSCSQTSALDGTDTLVEGRTGRDLDPKDVLYISQSLFDLMS